LINSFIVKTDLLFVSLNSRILEIVNAQDYNKIKTFSDPYFYIEYFIAPFSSNQILFFSQDDKKSIKKKGLKKLEYSLKENGDIELKFIKSVKYTNEQTLNGHIAIDKNSNYYLQNIYDNCLIQVDNDE
jgi:hypothetical protein